MGEIITEYKETVDSDCTLPILTSYKTEGVILQEEHFGRKQQHDITGYNILPRNYCTYRNRSDGVDFTFNINKCCDKGIISKFYPVFSGNNSDVFFLSLVLNNSEEVVHEIAYTCTGTGQKVLSFLDLQKMKVRVPGFDEQKKIAAYFDDLDHLITLHQRKCEDTKKLKKYMLQKMFPQNGSKVPEIRFKGFTDDWEQRKVGDITKELSEYAKLNSGLPLLTSARTGLMYQSDYRGNSTTDNENTLFSIVPLNACTYRHMSDDSTFHINVNTLEKGLVSKEYPVFVENESDLRFVVQYINSSDSFTKFCTEQKKGGTRTRLYYKTLCEYKMLIPSLNEQHIIADYFDNLDYLITLHQNKCEELKKIKKYMLQNMFV